MSDEAVYYAEAVTEHFNFECLGRTPEEALEGLKAGWAAWAEANREPGVWDTPFAGSDFLREVAESAFVAEVPLEGVSRPRAATLRSRKEVPYFEAATEGVHRSAPDNIEPIHIVRLETNPNVASPADEGITLAASISDVFPEHKALRYAADERGFTHELAEENLLRSHAMAFGVPHMEGEPMSVSAADHPEWTGVPGTELGQAEVDIDRFHSRYGGEIFTAPNGIRTALAVPCEDGLWNIYGTDRHRDRPGTLEAVAPDEETAARLAVQGPPKGTDGWSNYLRGAQGNRGRRIAAELMATGHGSWLRRARNEGG